MRWNLAAATWLFALSVGGGQTVPLPPELATLARIKTTVSQTLQRQPNYTCVQQIERSHRRLPKRKFELHDLLRVEVALVEGKEMFAWPGAHKFEQSDLTEMVTGGAIGTGDFALHARAIFQTQAPRFKYAGSTEVRSHKANQYDFVVSVIGSGYRIKSGAREAIVGYHGSFWADAESNELLRLEVNADDIPPELGIVSVQDVMDYGRVKIGASEFLLPVGSDLAMTDLIGNQSRNRTQFKSCRQYTGDSVLTFAGASGSDTDALLSETRSDAKKAKESIEIPADLILNIQLTTEIDSDSSAVGDAITATLDQKLTLKRRLLFPKGATLIGRILRLERDGDRAIIDLQFSEIESEYRRSVLLATVEEVAAPMSGSMHTTFGRQENRAGAYSGLLVRGNRIHLRPGARLRLRTLALVRPRATP
jgi:hypothetical protein